MGGEWFFLTFAKLNMNGAQVLFRMLQEQDVKVIFGAHGDTNMAPYEAAPCQK